MSGDTAPGGFLAIVALPEGHTTSTYLSQAKPKIAGLAVKYKNSDGNPPMNAEVQGYLRFLQTFLPWLEMDVTMTPTIRNQSQIDKALQLLFDPKYKCPEDIASRAKSIYEKFEDEQWGKDNSEGDDPDPSPVTSPLPSSGKPRRAAGAILTHDMYALARPPPPDHAIWGLHGIMHGFIIQPRTRKFNYVLDPRYEAEKRPFKTFGHNGLAPGAWWPYQKVALFHGAHGHSMAGISGQERQGAWSIVVSGRSKYEDLDHDLGDVLWYSSDQSHDNVDPVRIFQRSNMSLSMHTSISTGNPVRVLRSSGKGAFAPAYGIRYDGLYSVVKVVERTNSKGGLYEQFKLCRQPDQVLLQEICQSSPAAQQCAAYERIREGY